MRQTLLAILKQKNVKCICRPGIVLYFTDTIYTTSGMVTAMTMKSTTYQYSLAKQNFTHRLQHVLNLQPQNTLINCHLTLYFTTVHCCKITILIFMTTTKFTMVYCVIQLQLQGKKSHTNFIHNSTHMYKIMGCQQHLMQ